MNIKILKIADPGVADKERLVLKVITTDDVGRYIIFDTVQTGPTKISSHPRNVYWFPDREVKPEDLVVLYTKKGVNTQRVNDDGSTTFLFYWGKVKPLWNKPEEGPALLKVESFEFKPRV